MTYSDNEVGYLEMIDGPIGWVRGLPGITNKEVVIIDNTVEAITLAMDEEYVKVLILGDKLPKISSAVQRKGKKFEVCLGEGMEGKRFNVSLTNIALSKDEVREVDVLPPDISTRSKIKSPFYTGVSKVDMLVPLGKGQRELVIGDQKKGKSEFIFQTILNQANNGTLCIYCGIGKKLGEIKNVENFLINHNIVDKCIIISSLASSSLGEIFLTPFTGMTVAEYFRDKGRDVLLILDDMTSHARFYREMSLLLKKFPGRASYPGDIFYTHARILERAGNFVINGKEASITCLAIADTVESDISGYIQTNLMAITDGHIFFDKDLFEEGYRPPVNYFLSVTRVGRQTQSILRWGIGRELQSFFTLLRDTERFSHFGTELNQGLKATIQMGEKLFKFFNQPMGFVVPINVQILVFCLIWVGITGDIEKNDPAILLLKSCEKYLKEPDVKAKVDELVNGTNDFNQLLGKVSTKSSDILEWLSI